MTPDFYHISHTLKAGAPSEDIWMDAQLYGCWISFNHFGDLSVGMDSRWPYALIFAIRYSEWIDSTRMEAYFA